MSIISRIKGEIEKRGQKVDGIVQYSYNPRVNDAVQFLVYSDNQISHIVSTYRNPVDSWKRLHDQNDLMQSVLKKVQDTPLKENVLFSTWLLDLPQGCFRIQEFKEKAFQFQVSRFNIGDFRRYLDISCNWIINFQKVTASDTRPVSPMSITRKVKQDISILQTLYSKEPDTLTLLHLLDSKTEVVNTPMPHAMHHGDYCHWNCFVDVSGRYRVIDWEFAKISEWVIIDFVTNFIVTWMGLKNNKMVGEALKTFFDPQNDKEKIISQKLNEFKRLHGFSINEIKFYFVYVFIRLFLKKERPVSRIYWEPFLPDLISLLQSLH